MRVIPSQLEFAAPVPPQIHELREVRRACRSICRSSDAWAQEKCHALNAAQDTSSDFLAQSFLGDSRKKIPVILSEAKDLLLGGAQRTADSARRSRDPSSLCSSGCSPSVALGLTLCGSRAAPPRADRRRRRSRSRRRIPALRAGADEGSPPPRGESPVPRLRSIAARASFSRHARSP